VEHGNTKEILQIVKQILAVGTSENIYFKKQVFGYMRSVLVFLGGGMI